ncbi:MAG: endonuclease domain-containing protein [Xanthomonadales bacterium]|nr:endonuclease domain-containing protein [Xanthomonadales bacterium]
MADSRPPASPRDRARALRAAQTCAEERLWYHLRAGRLGGLKFKRQVPIGPFIVDFACHAHRLVVELDGGQHAEPAHQVRDRKRTALIERQGWRVLRFWNHDVLASTEAVLEAILIAVAGRPSPLAPPPQAGEGRSAGPSHRRTASSDAQSR